MSTDIVTALRQRMIEDMNARKLCAGTQRGSHPRLQAACCISEAVAGDSYKRGHPQFQLHLAGPPAGLVLDRREHGGRLSGAGIGCSRSKICSGVKSPTVS